MSKPSWRSILGVTNAPADVMYRNEDARDQGFGRRADMAEITARYQDANFYANEGRTSPQRNAQIASGLHFSDQSSADAWNAEHGLGFKPGTPAWYYHMRECGHEVEMPRGMQNVFDAAVRQDKSNEAGRIKAAYRGDKSGYY